MKKIILFLLFGMIYNGIGQPSIIITKKKIIFHNDQLYNILKDKKAVIKSINGKTWIKIPRGELTFDKNTGFYIFDKYIIRQENGIIDYGICNSMIINFKTNSITEIKGGDVDVFLKPIIKDIKPIIKE